MVLGVSLTANTGVLAATVTNGGFETGTLSGWTVVNQSGSNGSWYNYTGTSSPVTHRPIPAPPEGTHAAITDQTGPSLHELYQDITLAPGFTHTLTFTLFYHSYAAFTAPGPLTNPFPNQQYRIDVMKTSAADFSTSPADVLANVLQTKLGDPRVLAPTPVTFDLTPFAGQTVRLRFAAAVRNSNFNAGVDELPCIRRMIGFFGSSFVSGYAFAAHL